MSDIPRIISVDDHVVEPPDLWTTRLPAKFRDRGPRVERKKVQLHWGNPFFTVDVPDGRWGDVWMYDDLVYPFTRLSAQAGFAEQENTPITFDELRPGSWKQPERLADMAANYIDASLCYPNVLPRFAGQAFAEREDKELALLCVQAYNDWVIDEWCAGDAHGKLIPLTLVPLWDADLAAAEVHRCAGKGSYAVAFTENPYPLGLPTVHDPNRFWDPLFRACEETETVLNMHIGSSSNMPTTAPDSPWIVSSVLTYTNAMGSLLDYIFSGTLERFPSLKLAFSESQVGWVPYAVERADKLWAERSANAFGSGLPHPPSSYIPGRVYFCLFDDEVGLANRNVIGMEQITFESDYPHADGTFPHTKETAELICDKAGLNDTERYQLLRGNAIKAYGLGRFGIAS